MTRRRPAAGTVVSVVALTLVLGGTAVAASKIGTAQLKNNAVTSAKIKDGQVRTGDLATGAVTSRKIAARAVTTGKLADQAVTAAKIATGAVDGTRIAPAAIDETKVVPASLTGASIKPASIPASAVAAGSFIAGSGLSSADAGTLPSGTTGYRMLSLGGIDIFASCSSQILSTSARAFVADLYVLDVVTFNGQTPFEAAGVLQPGGAAASQAVATSAIGTVRWQASWRDTSGAHVRTAEISYQQGPGGCHFSAAGFAQN